MAIDKRRSLVLLNMTRQYLISSVIIPMSVLGIALTIGEYSTMLAGVQPTQRSVVSLRFHVPEYHRWPFG